MNDIQKAILDDYNAQIEASGVQLWSILFERKKKENERSRNNVKQVICKE